MSRRELERIYDAHASAAFALFLRFTRNEADARDLLQDWLVRIGRGLDALPEVASERAYLLTIARRQAIDWSRRRGSRRRRHESFAEEITTRFAPEANPDREELRRALETALAGLPEEQREVMELKLWDDLTFSEISEMLGLSPNTAASRYRYGIEKLRGQLRPWFEELRPS